MNNATKILKNDICDIATNKEFKELDKDIQAKVLEQISGEKNWEKSGGMMGKIFGSNKDNAAMNIAFVICVLLSGIGIACMLCGKECWNVIIPAIMTAVGYIFGRGDR